MNLFGAGKTSGKTAPSKTLGVAINRNARAGRRGASPIRPPRPTKPQQQPAV